MPGRARRRNRDSVQWKAPLVARINYAGADEVAPDVTGGTGVADFIRAARRWEALNSADPGPGVAVGASGAVPAQVNRSCASGWRRAADDECAGFGTVRRRVYARMNSLTRCPPVTFGAV